MLMCAVGFLQLGSMFAHFHSEFVEVWGKWLCSQGCPSGEAGVPRAQAWLVTVSEQSTVLRSRQCGSQF